jgi:DNA-binding PadR family transcriptional regulator
MEEEGLVISSWDLQDSGPPRRLYRLTEQGEELLHVWAANVEHYRSRLDRFLSIYRELVGDSRG